MHSPPIIVPDDELDEEDDELDDDELEEELLDDEVVVEEIGSQIGIPKFAWQVPLMQH